MFTVMGRPILEDELAILQELRNQLELNGKHYFHTFIPTTDHIQFSCPFHKGGQELKPSCGITKKDIYQGGKLVKAGTVHCFTCGMVCSLEEMISYVFDRDDFGIFGSEWLRKNFLTVEYENRPELVLDTSRGKKNNNTTINYVSEEELDSYRYVHPYMYTRKLTDEIIELFDVGYDKDFVLTSKAGKKYHCKCITFPVRDETGGTLFIARRSVETKMFHYPQGVLKPVYGLYELSKLSEYPKELCICESIIDCLTLWTHKKYAVALNGLGTDYQFGQLLKLPIRKFIIATDSDKAGMDAREKIKRKLKTRMLTEYILPEGRKDINECTWEEIENLQETIL